MFGLGTSQSDRAFYVAFENHAARIVEAAKLVLEIMREPGRARELAEGVHSVEHEGDKITHDTIARLHKTWITPIDRGDIHGLITALDDVLDLTEAVADRVALYELNAIPDFVASVAEVLVRATDAVSRAVRLLPHVKRPREMLDLCVEINRLENEADRDYRKAIATLFSGEYDALTAMKLRDIIDNLEAATDRCEDVANILEGIVLEYA